jgi:hypothetical protein
MQAQQILASAQAHDLASKKLKMLWTLIRSPSELVLSIPSPHYDSVIDPVRHFKSHSQVIVRQNKTMNVYNCVEMAVSK